jgi:hypothetical protein
VGVPTVCSAAAGLSAAGTRTVSPKALTAFDGIEAGDYLIVVQEQDCGYAVNAPRVTIKPSP